VFIHLASLIVNVKLPVKNWARQNVHKQRERFLLLFLLCGNSVRSAAQTELLQNPHLNHGDITYSKRRQDPDLARVVLAFVSSVPVFGHPVRFPMHFFSF